MSVENISLFNSVLDEALERLGKKNLKLKECQYEVVKAVVVERKDTICILPTGFGKSLIYQLLPFVLQSRTQSNACSQVKVALALGKRNELRMISYALT